jgi:hypothetical protein
MAGPTFTPIPQDLYSVNFPGSDTDGDIPEYRSVQGVSEGTNGANNVTWPTTKCTIKFNLPVKLKKPVFVYYRLTNFYQNHRRYVKSLDAKQLSGTPRQASDLKGGACDPLAVVEENGTQYPIYPCGLIANSVFNGAFPTCLHYRVVCCFDNWERVGLEVKANPLTHSFPSFPYGAPLSPSQIRLAWP